MALEKGRQEELLERIQQQSKENELIITSASEAIVAMDLDHRIFRWNPEAEKIFEWTREEAMGRHFFELVLPELLRTEVGSRFIEEFDQAGADEGLRRQELHLNKKSDLAFLADLMLQHIDNGETHYICAFVRDITDRKRYEDSLIQMRDSALSVATMKSEFLATMSHEIRTPLNGILGFADLLKETEVDDEQKLYLNSIQRSG